MFSNVFFRTECHATTIKYLRKIKQISNDEKDVKVDWILFNSQLGDIFSCEDKPAVAKEADVQADIKKGKELREKRLIYIKSILPHESLISSIEVTSAQFYGLSLTIYGSRMTNQGAIIHYQKAVANLPTAFSPPEIAHFLLTVMSLQVRQINLLCSFTIGINTFHIARHWIGSEKTYSNVPS